MVAKIAAVGLLLASGPALGQPPFNGPGGEPGIRQIQTLMAKLYPGIEAACSCTIVKLQIQRWQSWPDLGGWIVTWPDNATEQQRAAGYAFLAGFDPRDPVNLKR